VAGVCRGSACARAEEQRDEGPRGRAALLVGIDHYAAGEEGRAPPRLSGAKNDVRRVRELLLSRFGFARDDVLVLEDEQATHAAIVAAFHDRLIARSGPETEALFWFSGHGSRCEDLSGEAAREPGGKDSTFLAFDSRAGGAGSLDLTDDELHSLLHALGRRTARITVVTDACHSGGAVRGAGVLPPRFAEPPPQPPRPEDLAPLWPKDVPFVEDGDPRRLEPLSYVHLAACAHDEVANEHAVGLPSGDRLVHGALTFFLLDALERLQPGTTYERLACDVGVRLAAAYRGQQAQAEGAGLARVVFAGEFAAPLPGFEARLRPKSRLVEVSAGRMHLLRPESVLEIRGLGGETLGRAVLRRVEAASSLAEWSGEPPTVAAAAAARAIEVERAPDPLPLPLLVAPDPALDDLAAQLAKNERPRLAVLRDPALAAPLELAISSGGGGLELRERPEGFTLERFARPAAGRESGAPSLPAGLAERLAKEARFLGLLDLAHVTGSIPLSVELIELAPEATRDLGDRCVPAKIVRNPPGDGGDRRSGVVRLLDHGRDVRDIVDVRVRIDSSRRRSPAYVSILCVSEDRSVAPLYPTTQGARDNELAPGEHLDARIEVFASDPIPGLARPPRDRFLVIATELAVDFRTYTSPPAIAEPPELRGASDELPDILLDALAPCRTRGDSPTARAREQAWGIAALDVEVVAEGAPAGGN
jgi:hypothetical protein